MPTDFIHIVCLDAPSPPDYGGAIDIFYKIEALHAIGKKIILHYFNYNKARNAAGLEALCVKVHAYKRSGFPASVLAGVSYIVHSRIAEPLLNRLNADSHPVLLEGLHCTGLLPFIHRPQRVLVRMHNEEVSYYQHLAATEKNRLKKFYFNRESRLLKTHQALLDRSLGLAVLSAKDEEHFRRDGFTNISLVPCFIPWKKVESKTGMGGYCLYHGNLRVAENNAAALWLIKDIFSNRNQPLIIAGSGLSKSLQAAAQSYPNIRLINNPTAQELALLIADAQIHVLPSMNNTGVKLKLLNAVLNGRWCITNKAGVDGSLLQSFVTNTETVAEWSAAIDALFHKPFSEEEVKKREAVLQIYDNKKNASLLNERW